MLSLALATLTLSAPTQEPVPALDDVEVERVAAALTPDPDAPWRSIPWRIELLAAQREAAAAGLPLFVWAMDGHPLGCT